MKKWLASFIALSLVLAACGNDDSNTSKEHESSKTDKQTSQNKKDKPASESSKTNKDNAQNNGESNSGEDSNATTSNTNEGQGDASQNNVPQNDNGSTSKPGRSYVAPYQGQNVVPVAQNLARQSVDTQQALKQLPNFQTFLDAAQREVTRLNGQQNPYNDYAIQGEVGNYHYVFSFINQSQPGTYMIVTVDQTGQPKIVDPAYRQ
ncbi:hypothetical protein [Staphylococcus agnetis]|uniref:hypothetical protein n=1 Tax=Staphylococcus agnetis TaxID=985762 RepID=UPI001574B9CB|nr:hypothetical protein [Staphylococcus agnetis]MBY7663387.1 hypothetical protein [Staphylococcus agnetis]